MTIDARFGRTGFPSLKNVVGFAGTRAGTRAGTATSFWDGKPVLPNKGKSVVFLPILLALPLFFSDRTTFFRDFKRSGIPVTFMRQGNKCKSEFPEGIEKKREHKTKSGGNCYTGVLPFKTLFIGT